MYISIAGLSHKPQHTTPRGQPRFGYVHKVHTSEQNVQGGTRAGGVSFGRRSGLRFWPLILKLPPHPMQKKERKEAKKEVNQTCIKIRQKAKRNFAIRLTDHPA